MKQSSFYFYKMSCSKQITSGKTALLDVY